MRYTKGPYKQYMQRVNNMTLVVKRADATGDRLKRSVESS